MCTGDGSEEIGRVPETTAKPDPSEYAKIEEHANGASNGARPTVAANGSTSRINANSAYAPHPGTSAILTLSKEGEQFANAFFDTETKVKIATALADFGVEYIELTNPCSSQASFDDCKLICDLKKKNGWKTKILTHTRCTLADAKVAVQTGVDGLDVVIGTSSFLMQHSHGKDIAWIVKSALEVIEFVKSKGIEIRFSSEDSFRSDLVDLLSIYRAVDKIGVNRVGIADTVGCANPRQVYDLVRTLRGVVSCDIECHFHDDTGCSIANAYCALEAGATHVDTSVIGIGERNGITPLGGLIARLYAADPEGVKAKYNLPALREIENLVADAVQISIPFNNPITGFCAFTHKAGIHAKAILANPSTYEILKPEDFGLTRYVHIGSRLTGWNAIKSRVEQLGLELTDDQIKEITTKIKNMADHKNQHIDDVDQLLRMYHRHVESGAFKLGDHKTLDKLVDEHVNSPATDEPQANGKVNGIKANGVHTDGQTNGQTNGVH